MPRTNGPTVVRYPAPGKPGLHSHNATRRLRRTSARLKALLGLRAILLIIGLSALSYYGYTLADEYIYQAYENWAFDQQIAGRPAVTFADYLRERTPFGFLVGNRATTPSAAKVQAPAVTPPSEAPRPMEGALLGRVEISRLHLSAIVREGVDSHTLSIAVGHVPSTALPGNAGNFAIAAHRDTLFRALKDIRIGDTVTFQSPSGSFTYKVAATKIVKPSDVSVLRPDGGGLIQRTQAVPVSDPPAAAPKLLTMITCYPFYYVGAAPKRFIVEAEQVANDPDLKFSGSAKQGVSSPLKPVSDAVGQLPPKEIRPAPHPVRSSSRLRQPRPPGQAASARAGNPKSHKKHGFWHKLLHFK